MSIIPSPWPVCHIARYIDTTVEDSHGNSPEIVEPPVIRKVMSITQFGRRGSSREVMGPEFAARVETTIHISVADPTLYSSDDQVVLWPDVDTDGNYVPDTGIAYWVDGEPSDEREGPWPTLLSMFGGTVKLRRVT